MLGAPEGWVVKTSYFHDIVMGASVFLGGAFLR